jgi:hypothetical protein
MPIRMPMIAITTNSSTSVKPLWSLVLREGVGESVTEERGLVLQRIMTTFLLEASREVGDSGISKLVAENPLRFHDTHFTRFCQQKLHSS